jgi:hypothetical protein
MVLSLPVPLPSGHEGQHPVALPPLRDLIDLERGLLRDEVHAALAPCQGSKGSPRRGALRTFRVVT